MAEFKKVAKQLYRMCETIPCEACGIQAAGGAFSCGEFIFENPEKAEKIIMDWAAKYPEKTMKDVLLEKFPNVQLNWEGMPPFCVREFGLPGQKDCARPCKECWNSPAPEE